MSIGILPNVNSIKLKRVVRPGISVCSRIIRLTNNQTKSRKRATMRRQEWCGCCKNFLSDGLRLERLGSISFSKWKTVPGKPGAKSLDTDSMNTIHSVYATSSMYPGKDRTIACKIQVENPHQRSPYATKFEDRSDEETERQQRCARSKAWNLAKNTCTSSKKKTYLHTRPRRNGYSPLRQHKSRRKESF